MSSIPRFPYWWNRVAEKTKRKEAFSLKMNFVKFNIVFYVLFMLIAVTNTTEVPSKKAKFEWLEIDASSVNADSQSLKYCIHDLPAISGWKGKIYPNGSLIEPISILCEHERNETRYIIAGSRWSSLNLTYKIISYPRRTEILGGYAAIDREFKNAFTLWESATDLRFTATKDWYEADINIRFLSRFHGDDRGEFMSLNAHAFQPLAGGDIHFNDDKEWTIGTSLGHNIFQTAAHELGHTLGLHHYRNNDSVMYPSSKEYISNFTLHSDDIEAIQIIYGKKSKATQPKQEHASQPWLLITWAVITVACILSGVIIAVGVTQIVKFRKQVSKCYWTQVEFGMSLK